MKAGASRKEAAKAAGVTEETLAVYITPGHATRIRAEDRAWTRELAWTWGYAPELIAEKSNLYHERKEPFTSTTIRPLTLTNIVRFLFYGKPSELVTAAAPVQEFRELSESTIHEDTKEILLL